MYAFSLASPNRISIGVRLGCSSHTQGWEASDDFLCTTQTFRSGTSFFSCNTTNDLTYRLVYVFHHLSADLVYIVPFAQISKRVVSLSRENCLVWKHFPFGERRIVV